MREQLDTRIDLYSKKQGLINRFDGSASLEKASEEHYKASLEELKCIKSAKEKKVNSAHVFFELGVYHYHHLPKDCRNAINMVSVNYFLVFGLAVYASRVSNYELNNDDSVCLSTLLPDFNGLIKCYKNGDPDKLKAMLEALTSSNLESPKMRCRL